MVKERLRKSAASEEALGGKELVAYLPPLKKVAEMSFLGASGGNVLVGLRGFRA